jgi:hypothetical protein
MPGLAKLIERAGIEATIGCKVHPHMLRHAAGFVLANKGTDTRKRTLAADVPRVGGVLSSRSTDSSSGRPSRAKKAKQVLRCRDEGH